MSLVGEPFGNCWKPSTPPKPAPEQPRTEQPAPEPQESYHPNEPFSHCWTPSRPAPAQAPSQDDKPAPEPGPDNFQWDPSEPFRYPNDI
ncbi:MAG: hypothetical protein AB7S38_24240 [Vulcanimicrobiota bacterium]